MSRVMPKSDADAVAAIALDLPVHPTSGDVLRALTRAYSEGFQNGFAASSQHHSQTNELIKELLE